jgi:hypothetical protein
MIDQRVSSWMYPICTYSLTISEYRQRSLCCNSFQIKHRDAHRYTQYPSERSPGVIPPGGLNVHGRAYSN